MWYLKIPLNFLSVTWKRLIVFCCVSVKIVQPSLHILILFGFGFILEDLNVDKLLSIIPVSIDDKIFEIVVISVGGSFITVTQ